MTGSHRLLALTLLTLPCLAGCFSFGDDVDPIVEIDDDQYVVVHPFDDFDYPSAWDSPRGHDLALRVTDILNRSAEFLVCPYNDVLELLVAPPAAAAEGDDAAIGLDVRRLTPRQVADLTGADYVILCRIKQFEVRDPLNINLVKGTATAEVRTFKVAKTKREREHAEEEAERIRRMNAAREKLNLETSDDPLMGGSFVGPRISTVTAHYPTDYLNQYGEVFLSQDVVRAGLMKELARKVAELFYSHEVERQAGSGS